MPGGNGRRQGERLCPDDRPEHHARRFIRGVAQPLPPVDWTIPAVGLGNIHLKPNTALNASQLRQLLNVYQQQQPPQPSGSRQQLQSNTSQQQLQAARENTPYYNLYRVYQPNLPQPSSAWRPQQQPNPMRFQTPASDNGFLNRAFNFGRGGR